VIDDMLTHLDIRDDELDDVVVVVEEVEDYQKGRGGWRSGKFIHQDHLVQMRYLGR
jgi:hypothetical protein